MDITETDHVYHYTTLLPPPTRFTRNDLPGHQLGYTKRYDVLTGKNEWQARCTCKDKDTGWFSTKTRAERHWWDGHVSLVEKQGKLFP